jgi:hypothetical protein
MTESGMSAGGAGMLGILVGGAGIVSLGYANKRTVAISTGLASVFDTIVPDNVFCAIIAVVTANNSNIILIRLILTSIYTTLNATKTVPKHFFTIKIFIFIKILHIHADHTFTFNDIVIPLQLPWIKHFILPLALLLS